ncbi:hypothetical protein, partial [Bartonella bovis]|uniref:hypothetical protein n=1 Tax=Bartonella bovis TaxID=155194 RepID=UPI001304C2FB
NINKYLGGGANVLAGTQPTYQVNNEKYNDVGSAFAGVDSTLTDLYEKLDQVESGGSNDLVVQDGGSKVITIGAQA